MVIKIIQLTYSEYWEAVKDLTPEQRDLSPYYRRVKFRDVLQDDEVGYEEFMSLSEKRFDSFEKEVSDPNNFDYFVNETKRLWYLKDMDARYISSTIIIPFSDIEEEKKKFPNFKRLMKQC